MEFFKKVNLLRKIIIWLFVVFFIWWIILQLVSNRTELWWGNLYQLIALIGGIGGLYISNYLFYEMKSLILVRRAIFFFSIGLLLQVLGQNVFSYYNMVLKVPIPYPSFADVGYFGSVLCYLYALILLAGITGVKLTFKSFISKIEFLLIPAVILLVSFTLFLKGYAYDLSSPVRIFLDFAYPIIEAVYVSLALIILLFAKDLVGGVMKWPSLLLAMFVQYIADFNFLYQAKNGTWVSGRYGDLLYMIAYFILALALIRLGITFQKLLEKNERYE